ncbi:MAG: glucose-6-phosphate dehydrogenase [Paracoccaceae bacterium]
MVSRIIPVEAFDLVIFGGTGDLARRKILPGLYHRMLAGQMPRRSRIIAAARSQMTSEEYRTRIGAALDEVENRPRGSEEDRKAFLDCLHYVRLDASEDDGWPKLAGILGKDGNPVRAFYLSVGPWLFAPIARRLRDCGVVTENCRLVVEKPFGSDLASARLLNRELAEVVSEKQIYRIDHYLGKETVQNLMVLRFANALLEPVWNAHQIDHVQITVAESIGVNGRGAYYDQSGAMRDMVQNHLMQLLCLTAMEPPARYDPDAVRDEKLKVIRALDPVEVSDTVRGQYRAGNGEGSYLEHAGNPDSLSESFVAIKAKISNWRWSGVPFYLRTGKRLRARMSEIAVIFKDPPHSIFPDADTRGGNSLAIRLQPDEGIELHKIIKEPGQGGLRLREVPLDMTFADALSNIEMADAYERLIMDVIRGDQTLFMRGDEVEAAWAWTDPIVAAWEEAGEKPQPYDAGGSGPDDALALLHRDGRRWREIEA